MQIWRTARLSPGTSCMEARLVRPGSFVLTILLQKRLVSSSMWSTSFRCVYELLCLWTLRERIELFHRWPRKLRENSGDEGKEFTFNADLKFEEDLWENRWHDELMWCFMVFKHDLHDQCLPQGKEKLLLEDPLSQKGKLFTSATTRTESRTKWILRCKWTSVAPVDRWKYWAKWHFLRYFSQKPAEM